MKKLALFAIPFALACSALAVTDNNQNGRPGNPGHVHSVPDAGSTALLLGLGLTAMVVLLPIARREPSS